MAPPKPKNEKKPEQHEPESKPDDQAPKKGHGRDIGGYLKKAALIAGAGGLAGGVETIVASPLQTISSTIIVQPILSDPRKKCGNIIDCMHKIHSANGAYGFYKDLPSRLISNIPRKAILFLTYTTVYKIIQNRDNKKKESGSGNDPNTDKEEPTARQLSAPFIAGAAAGIGEAFLANPFETVTTNVQAMKCKTCVSGQSQMSEQVYTKLVREGGFGGKGLNKGLLASMWRHGLFNLCYFGFYNLVKPTMCCGYKERKGCTVTNSGCTFYAAFVSGVIGSIVSSPFHIAQTRIQAPANENLLCRYQTVFQTLKVVQREEGIHALWRGLLSRMIRYGIGGGALMVAFEYFHDKFLESPEPEKDTKAKEKPPEENQPDDPKNPKNKPKEQGKGKGPGKRR